MNPTEQRQRRDAIREIRAELETVLDDFKTKIGNELEMARAERRRDLKTLRTENAAAQGATLASAIKVATDLSEPIRRGFWGRRRWWWTGW